MADPRECFCIICNTARIDVFKQAHQFYSGKPICEACVELLLHGNFLKKPVPADQIQTQIPSSLGVGLVQFEVCNFHQKKSKLYCTFCQVGLCVLCVPSHKLHTISEYEVLTRSVAQELYDLEFAFRFIALALPEKAESAFNYAEELFNLFTGLSHRHQGLSQVQTILLKYKTFLGTLNPDFLGFTPAEARNCVENGREKANSLGEPMHWCEWNSNIIHVTDLMTMTKSTHVLSIKVPFYTRSITLPHSQILLCGGRTEMNSQGIHSAWLIHMKEVMRVEQINDMILGRSNHLLISLGGYVYAIAGCDQDNVFTNRCERLNIDALTWEEITSTNEIRDTSAGVGVAAHNALYIFGGRIDNALLSDTVEKYSIPENCWRVVRIKLSAPKSVHGAVLLPNTRATVLIFAGQDAEGKTLSTACILDLEKNKTEQVTELPSNLGCVVNEAKTFRGRVYTYIFSTYNSRMLFAWTPDTKEWVLESSS